MTLHKQELLKFSPLVVTVLLIALSAVLSANLFLSIFFKDNVYTPASSQQLDINTKPKANNPVDKIALNIANKHIFGQAGNQQAPAEPVKEDFEAPETKLDYKLRGILATGDKLGLAIISKGSAEEKMYKIDDDIPGGATLKAVYADRVLIQSSRGLETLRIELEKNNLSTSPKRTADLGSDEGNLPTTSTRLETGALAKLRKELIKKPLSFAKKISIKPEKDESGSLVGYKLNPAQDAELFSQIGLQAGDIATKLNGIDLTQSKNTRRAMNILRRSKKLNMTVIRNGQEFQIEQQL